MGNGIITDRRIINQPQIKLGNGRCRGCFLGRFSLDVLAHQMQGKSAIQPASVQMGKIEMCRQTFCQRPLAAGCRSVYRDDHSIASAAEIAAPHPFIRGAKSGKLVLIVMHPVTVIAASLTMPRVRNDMAIL